MAATVVAMAMAMAAVARAQSPLAIPPTWEVLGPYPWGMREQGGDLLAAYGGGIADLPLPYEGLFPSELADAGVTGTVQIDTSPDNRTVGPITFPDVRWSFNRDFYGWTVNQWQAWARGDMNVSDEQAQQTWAVRCANVGEYWIDDQRFHGDWYGYGERWSRVVLDPGVHRIRVRLASEVRLFGGGLPPSLTFVLEFQPVNNDVVPLQGGRTVPEAVDGRLVSAPLALGLFNGAATQAVATVAAVNDTRFTIALSETTTWASSQSGTVALLLTQTEASLGECSAVPLEIGITVAYPDEDDRSATATWTVRLLCRAASDAFKLTFVDYDGSVHYNPDGQYVVAMARRPRLPCPSGGCAVLASLHGAGVEASSEAWTSAYDQLDTAWLLYPTGRTPWGYDWHGASRLNVESALATLAAWSPAEVNLDKIFASGHSNGGQGCWYWTSHYPDRFLASTPAAGYVKIQLYVPFFWRPGDSHADPVLRAILESSIAEFDTDLYTANLVGMPLLARTGGADDNVPPLHSRRLVRLVNEHAGATDAAGLSEVPGAPHYFDGVMNGDDMAPFLDRYATADASRPAFPGRFTAVTLNPASSGSRGTVHIYQLRIPFRFGRVHVEQEAGGLRWTLRTENVRRFALQVDPRAETLSSITLDGQTDVPLVRAPAGHYCRLDGSTWTVCYEDAEGAWTLAERSPTSSGPILQVWDRPTVIIVGTLASPASAARYQAAASVIASDFFHYSLGKAPILTDVEALNGADLSDHNLILLGGPATNAFAATLRPRLPVVYDDDDGGGGETTAFAIGGRRFAEPDLGLLFLAPWRAGVAVVIDGTDLAGFERAADLFPIRTGTTMPDFVVISSEQAWKAAGGLLAAGFWAFDWTYSDASGYLR